MSSGKDSSYYQPMNGLQLERANWRKWYEMAAEEFHGFLEAGKELLTEEQIDWEALEPMIQKYRYSKYRKSDNTIGAKREVWTDLDTSQLAGRLITYQRR
jgi:hypothetical protein